MTKKTFKEILIVVALILFAIVFVIGLDMTLIPLLFSTFLAYASLPLVKYLETKAGLSRVYATATVVTVTGLCLLVIGILILPPLFDELREAIFHLPEQLSTLLEKVNGLLSGFGFHVPYDRQSLTDFAHNFFENMSSDVVKTSGNFVKTSLLSATSFVVVVLNVFLIPIFFVYVVNDCEGLLNQVKNLVPLSWRPRFEQFLKQCDQILSGFIRGQLLVCSILAVVYSAGLLLVSVKFGLLIGIMTGLFTFIPYVGFSFGLLAALLSAASQIPSYGYGPLIGVLVVYGMGQALETYVVTPGIVGNKVGLSPFQAILSLIVFGNLLGFAGLFIAIPAGAIVKVLMGYIMQEYRNTNFYKKVND